MTAQERYNFARVVAVTLKGVLTMNKLSVFEMLQSDHSAANVKALDAAKELGVKAPEATSAAQKHAYDRMAKMSGATFDKRLLSIWSPITRRTLRSIVRRRRELTPPGNMRLIHSQHCRNI
jgi:hypothetical protein